jgi:hypothetical protein
MKPEPALIGKTPEERAETRMWVRRIDLTILEPMANGFRFGPGLKMFQGRLYPAGGGRPGVGGTGEARLARLADDRQYLCLRRSADPGRHFALRLPRLCRRRRSADQPRAQEHRRLARPHDGAAERRGLKLISRHGLGG